jgi:asparagine synthase (glutamine-hydrolysing)
MCGIAGIIRFNGAEIHSSEIKALTDAIAHRGPDGEGCWIHENKKIGLGHRRLSIIDLTELGAQPMHYADGRYTITYNGELFNFLELREELLAKGYQFLSDSDTEVLLAAYHAWGKDCLLKFNGFWAFAIWDEQEQELFLARDRFGIKPLYYLHQKEKQLVFASETNQFKHIDGYTREADPTLIPFVIQNSWGLEGIGKTIYKSVQQIKPGHHLTVNLHCEIKEHHWWKTEDHLVDVPSSYDEQVKQFKSIFEDAVKLRLRSDVSIASALSGGLDSSSVYSTIHHLASNNPHLYRLPKDWQKAFVAVFPGTAQDERSYAEEVIRHTKGSAVYVDMNDEHLSDRLINSVKQYDTIYSTPLFILDGVYGAMRKNGVTVSMDGHGVDEMLYGYPTNVMQALQFAKENNQTDYATDLENTLSSMLNAEERKRVLQTVNGQEKKVLLQRLYHKIKRGINKVAVQQPWLDEQAVHNACLLLPDVPTRFQGPEAVLYQTFHHTVLPTVLRNFDRGAMQNSIEIRMPFLDYRLVCYVFSLPMQSKLGHGFTKRILRDAMKGILPEPIRTRKLKIGFNAPLKSWYQHELKEMIRDEVSSTAFTQSHYWNGSVIRDFVLEQTKKQSWTEADSFRFWPVLNAHLLLKS